MFVHQSFVAPGSFPIRWMGFHFAMPCWSWYFFLTMVFISRFGSSSANRDGAQTKLVLDQGMRLDANISAAALTALGSAHLTGNQASTAGSDEQAESILRTFVEACVRNHSSDEENMQALEDCLVDLKNTYAGVQQEKVASKNAYQTYKDKVEEVATQLKTDFGKQVVNAKILEAVRGDSKDFKEELMEGAAKLKSAVSAIDA